MKVEIKTDYVKANVNIKNGEFVKVVGEGKMIDIPQDKTKQQMVIEVELPNGNEKLFPLNNRSKTELVKAWGDESKDWIGKSIAIQIVQRDVFGEMKDVIYAIPTGENGLNKGGLVKRMDEKIPIVEDD